MGAHRDPVKEKRSYDSSRRRAQAERTRLATVDTARRLFLEHGYAATTIATVAAEAGVSPESIYKSFGTKAALLRAIVDQALTGTGPVPAEQRSDRVKHEEADGRVIIATWAQLTTEVAPRGAPILLLIRDAAVVDPDLASLAREIDEARLARMEDNARALHDHGHLRPGLSVEQARDLCYLYTRPELYETLVLERGWSVADFGAFIERALGAALLP